MKHDNALYLVRHMMKRYHSGGAKTLWAHRGLYVPQWLIPVARKGIEAAVEAHVKRGPRERIEYINPGKCFSTQYHLNHNRLCRAMKNYGAWQRETARLPVVFEWRGRYLIWNGNHRITCALILGKTRMRARVWRPKRARKVLNGCEVLR